METMLFLPVLSIIISERCQIQKYESYLYALHVFQGVINISSAAVKSDI